MISNIERHTLNKYNKNKINREKEINRKKINKEKGISKFKSKINKNNNTNNDLELEQDIQIPIYYNNSKFKLQIQKSTIECAGLGVFTLEPIPAKVCIGKYEGVKRSHNKTGNYYLEINYKVGIDAESYPRCYMAMINDVFNTENIINCEFLVDEINKIVEIWSIKNIDADSELFISYGDCYWIEN